MKATNILFIMDTLSRRTISSIMSLGEFGVPRFGDVSLDSRADVVDKRQQGQFVRLLDKQVNQSTGGVRVDELDDDGKQSIVEGE